MKSNFAILVSRQRLGIWFNGPTYLGSIPLFTSRARWKPGEIRYGKAHTEIDSTQEEDEYHTKAF